MLLKLSAQDTKLSVLPTGMYLIKIENEGVSSAKKIIISK
ncbi:MAG: T9SS type A sorting domain-containing protein [Bacteroidetes bacterium]|nr:T9SS type A sorting domain-containing protein [Bacteroidota bacterium]